QRTEMVNALRAVLYEYGHIVPRGMVQLSRMQEIAEAPNSDLPKLVREECLDLVEQIADLTRAMPGRRRQRNLRPKPTWRAVSRQCPALVR
ncbi:hypothetical protein NKH65_22510, partial [Mesorhizobium australicum]